jgi:hypothetical protein
MVTGEYTPQYTGHDAPQAEPPPSPASLPPQQLPAHAPPPPPSPYLVPTAATLRPETQSARPDRWKAFIAPVAAGLVLLLGIGFLLVRPGGDSPTADDEDVRTTRERDDPPVTDDGQDTPQTVPVSSAPRPTPPPLVEPPVSTTPSSTPTISDLPETSVATTVATTAGPTVDEARAALITLDDLANPEWVPDTLDETTEDPCGTTPEEALATVDETVIFARVTDSPIAVRQISNTIISFPDVDTATRAFDNDIQLLRNCNGTTADISGVTYDVSIEISKFDESQVEAFACADDNTLIIGEFTSDDPTVPYLGIASASFRCGVNITVVSFVTTVNVDDLNDDDYFAATATSNLQVGVLPGSS